MKFTVRDLYRPAISSAYPAIGRYKYIILESVLKKEELRVAQGMSSYNIREVVGIAYASLTLKVHDRGGFT